MNNRKIFCVFLVLIFASGIAYTQGMENWLKAGSKPNEYETGVRDEKYNDQPVNYIKSIQDSTGGFGTLMKYILPGDYVGKRVKLTGYIKTENVTSSAGMWMRVDSEEEGKMLGFDNMNDRLIKGTNDWAKYEIVLDVPKGTKGIGYGVLIEETGEVWFLEPTFEIVGNDVPVTNMLVGQQQTFPVKENYSELPDELKNIPDGIEVTHDPAIAYATKIKEDTAFYYWFYKTSVKALNEDLDITEFGSYTWVTDHWQFSTVTGKPFEPKDFADWYDCKKGKMKKGHEYSDKSNWYRGAFLQGGKALWYYIGKNKKGELFKGVAIVDYLSEMRK